MSDALATTGFIALAIVGLVILLLLSPFLTNHEYARLARQAGASPCPYCRGKMGAEAAARGIDKAEREGLMVTEPYDPRVGRIIPRSYFIVCARCGKLLVFSLTDYRFHRKSDVDNAA
jgi:hypothetical protein